MLLEVSFPADIAEIIEDGFGVVECDVGVGDDGNVLAEIGLGGEDADLSDEAGFDEDVVGTGAEIDRDSRHVDDGNELKEGEKSCQNCMRMA